jgi:ribosomal protein S18 acetylase RimI-like enzyme
MTWTVREATPSVAPAVREIARESWHAAYDDILGAGRVAETVTDWYAVDDLERAITDASEREDAVFVVADRSGPNGECEPDIVGFAHADVRVDAPAAPADTAVALLIRIYVRPSAWSEGVGTALLERVETALQGQCDRLRLVVLADNAAGVSFYESSGFERVEVRESDLGEGLEEYVYEKSL